MEIPVYLERPGEHPEIREQVGVCRVRQVNGKMEILGDVELDDEHGWLGELLETMDAGMGFGPKGGCMVLRPPTGIGGDERLA